MEKTATNVILQKPEMMHSEADKKRSCCARYADLLFLNKGMEIFCSVICNVNRGHSWRLCLKP